MYLFTRLVALLPARMQPYAKSLAPAVATIVGAGATWVATGDLDTEVLRTAVGGAVLTLLAFVFPNLKQGDAS